MIDLNDRLDLAFLKKKNGRFVYGIGCFVKDRLSFTKQALPSTNSPLYLSKNARSKRWFRLVVF